MNAGNNGPELEGPLPGIDRVTVRDPQVIIAEQYQAGRVVRGHPQFASGPVFPQMDMKRYAYAGGYPPEILLLV